MHKDNLGKASSVIGAAVLSATASQAVLRMTSEQVVGLALLSIALIALASRHKT